MPHTHPPPAPVQAVDLELARLQKGFEGLPGQLPALPGELALAPHDMHMRLNELREDVMAHWQELDDVEAWDP